MAGGQARRRLALVNGNVLGAGGIWNVSLQRPSRKHHCCHRCTSGIFHCPSSTRSTQVPAETWISVHVCVHLLFAGFEPKCTHCIRIGAPRKMAPHNYCPAVSKKIELIATHVSFCSYSLWHLKEKQIGGWMNVKIALMCSSAFDVIIWMCNEFRWVRFAG